MKRIIAEGQTYQAKDVLKAAGFEFDRITKSWFGTEEAMRELDRITTAAYSRSNLKAVSGITFRTIDMPE